MQNKDAGNKKTCLQVPYPFLYLYKLSDKIHIKFFQLFGFKSSAKSGSYDLNAIPIS